jgi:hypothetical protein
MSSTALFVSLPFDDDTNGIITHSKFINLLIKQYHTTQSSVRVQQK